MFQDGLDLLAAHAWKPVDEIANGRPSLNVLEKGPDRHSRALENPIATNETRHLFHRGALRPIEHTDSIAPRGRSAQELLPRADPFFKDFALVRISRLSVMPVTDAQWKKIETLAAQV